jgi:hypothetical protein
MGKKHGVTNGTIQVHVYASYSACSFGWWLMLICSERKVLLVGCWWMVCSERRVLLTGG